MGTFNSAVLPASTGLQLGSPSQSWNIYANTLTVASTVAFTSVTSSSANPAQTGKIQLASSDAINFRNFANSADINGLSKNTSDVVVIGGAAGISTTFNAINGVSVVGNGAPLLVAKVDLPAQTAAIGTTTLYTPSLAANYRLSVYAVVTTTGNAVSMNSLYAFTDADSGQLNSPISLGSLNIGAAAGTFASLSAVLFRAKSGTAIQYSTTVGGAIGAGVYAIYLRLEQL